MYLIFLCTLPLHTHWEKTGKTLLKVITETWRVLYTNSLCTNVYYIYLCVRACSVLQLGLTLCDPMDCSSPGSFVHRVFQTRILEWVALYFSRGSSQSRDEIRVSFISFLGRQILSYCATLEAWLHLTLYQEKLCTILPQ